MSLIPTLKTNFLTTDNDYVANWNNNFVSILNSFTAVSNALTASFDGTNFLFNEDWTRAPSGYTGGVLIGPDSCVLSNTGSNTVTLTNANAANVSVFWDGTKRRQHTGDLTIGLDSVTVADPSSDTVVYIGVSASGDTDFTGYISLTAGVGFDLYKGLLDRSGSTYTLHTITRLAQYGFNNVLVQKQLDKIEIFDVVPPTNLAGLVGIAQPVPVVVPYEHELVYAFMHNTLEPSTLTTTATVAFTQEAPTSTAYGNLSFDISADHPEPSKLMAADMTGGFTGMYLPADVTYGFQVTAQSGATLTGPRFGVAVRPRHNSPSGF